MSLNEESYWMVTGQWLKITGGGLATLENPNPQLHIMPMMKTEFIAMHPARYCILMQNERPQYALLLALMINKKMFDSILQLSESANKAGTNGKGEESEQKLELESSEDRLN